ncbi:ABC transporter ATP-binding protein [Undibacterium sp. LX40W]|uniref:ABC transporter ATP-binding protein n=1 Tax=Undibacterium nitidum TaxID=2762298 RepID=A0A923KVL8_9BURK|nr:MULTISPECIES: ABC transporter ATP-binding protein [Undibacterium]MBC3883277.1 ABC transporter ATP-binding protein [Undibacterium nitidum]MBC3893576.1 ABC transporter ATP-binding protein [Undibacterium sp. LX40W]
MSAIISARQLSKSYGKKPILNNLNFEIESGRIVGVVGPNGSGKTTILKTILGLAPFSGQLSVLGFDPATQRDALMNEVCFVADVAVLPRWLKVREALDFVEGVHPRFNRAKAERYIAETKLTMSMKVKEMSKGMLAQFHLALVMAIDAKLLVLDEPTLGLDILYRKMFYRNLLEDYFDENKTIIITTHQIEEVENILSDVIFVREGQIVLHETMEKIQDRFTAVLVNAEQVATAQKLKPLDQRKIFEKQAMLFDGVPRQQLAELGELQTPDLADIFVALMKGSY